MNTIPKVIVVVEEGPTNIIVAIKYMMVPAVVAEPPSGDAIQSDKPVRTWPKALVHAITRSD